MPDSLLLKCVELAQSAGEAIMKIYDSGNFTVEYKADNSPLTIADETANNIIETGLSQISDYPIISEEGNKNVGSATTFWLVDPLDGTKEFVARNGEFTVNISLVENGKPVLGVVLAPAKNVLYYGAKGMGAFKQSGESEPERITAEFNGDIPVVFASRSHRGERLEDFLAKLGGHTEIFMGSSLKICLVADGTAAIYPRFSPCMLWDTAAADAILRAAGGQIRKVGTNEPLAYDPSQLLNPHFLACAKNYSHLDF